MFAARKTLDGERERGCVVYEKEQSDLGAKSEREGVARHGEVNWKYTVM